MLSGPRKNLSQLRDDPTIGPSFRQALSQVACRHFVAGQRIPKQSFEFWRQRQPVLPTRFRAPNLLDPEPHERAVVRAREPPTFLLKQALSPVQSAERHL